MANAKPVLVLVPGSYHRPSSFNAVTERLRSRGFTVLAPALAVAGDAATAEKLRGKTPLDDVAVIHRELLPLLDQGQQAVIVSHSYGSFPGSLAVEGQTIEERAAKGLKGGIKGIVTIAGFAFPVRGKGIAGDESEPPLLPYLILEVSVAVTVAPCSILRCPGMSLHIKHVP